MKAARMWMIAVLALPVTSAAQQFRVITSNTWESGFNGFNHLTGQLPLGHAKT